MCLKKNPKPHVGPHTLSDVAICFSIVCPKLSVKIKKGKYSKYMQVKVTVLKHCILLNKIYLPTKFLAYYSCGLRAMIRTKFKEYTFIKKYARQCSEFYALHIISMGFIYIHSFMPISPVFFKICSNEKFKVLKNKKVS
jgi:hypothetical protein